MADSTAKTHGSCIKVTGTTDVSTEITAEIIFIKSVYWYNPTNAAHLCNLVDKDGGPIITMKGAVSGSDPASQQWDIGHVFDGIYCDDLDSGTLFIYVR